MLRRLVPLALAAACASKGGEGAGGQGDAPEVVLPPAPEGAAWKTARGVAWKEMLEDLAGADAVFVDGDDALELGVLDYLSKRGRLHAIGLWLPRSAQPALDDFCFGRIDASELEKRCGPIGDPDRRVLAFAAERRLPVLGLRVEDAIFEAAAQGGLEALTEEQRRSLPAVRPADPKAEDPLPLPPLATGLLMDVAVDLIVGWYRAAAPEGAQVVVLGSWGWKPRSLAERLLQRSGKTYRTLVAVTGKADAADPAVFAKSYTDYVWFVGASGK